MSPKVTLRVVLLFAVSVTAARAQTYSRPLQKGQTVSEIARLYTGKTSLWKNSGVQVKSGRTGRQYTKSNPQYRHLAVGDIVTVNASLVPAHSELTHGQSLSVICSSFATSRCDERLMLINRLEAAGAIPAMILVPNFFVQIKPLPAPPPALPVPPPAVPEYRSAFKFWLLLLLVLLATLLADIFALPRPTYAPFYRTLPKTSGGRYRFWPYILAHEVRDRVSVIERGLIKHGIWIKPRADSLIIYASEPLADLAINVLKGLTAADGAYGQTETSRIPAVQIVVTQKRPAV